jgi:hypothetical protein
LPERDEDVRKVRVVARRVTGAILYERFRCPLLAARADLERRGVSGLRHNVASGDMETWTSFTCSSSRSPLAVTKKESPVGCTLPILPAFRFQAVGVTGGRAEQQRSLPFLLFRC